MKSKTKASIFLMIICVQYLLIGFNFLNVSSNSTINSEDPEDSQSIQKNTSHASPYYFPVNRSTPLMTEEDSESFNQDSPKSASYYYYNDGFILTLNLDKYVLTPGETVTINLVLTLNLTAAAGESVSVEIYDEFYRDFRWYDPDYYDGMFPIYSTSVITDGNGQASFSFSSTTEIGIYTVYAYIDESRAYKEFSVGNKGVFCKGPIYFKPDHTYTAAVHIVNISNFAGIPFSSFIYSISYYEYSFTDWFLLTTDQIQTDDMGYAIFNIDIPAEMDDYYVLKLTLRTLDGEAEYETYLYKSWDYYYYSLWGGQQPTNQKKLQFVVTTDKTIYSPGEFIHLRALVLEYSFMNESKQALKNSEISLTIYNPDDLAIFWSTLITDDHGIITYTLPLDEDCELGEYGFEFSSSNNDYRYNVRVDHYVKPVFRVEIDTNGKDFYSMIDNTFKGFVYVSYYFGQPVVGADVELTIIDYMGNEKATINGVTNSEGKFHFVINLLFLDLEYSFKIEANVVDTYGRSAYKEKTYTRIEHIFAYGYLSNWAPHPEEYSEYYFYVYQYVMHETDYGWWSYSYNPLANVSVKIEIYGIEGYPYYRSGITNEVLLETLYSQTNNYGSGKLEFKLPLNQISLYDLFEIRLTVKLKDSRTTTSSYYYRYQKYSLDIDIVDSTLDPGQVLEFDVTFRNILTGLPSSGEGRIYIYDSKHQIIGRTNQVITGTKRYTLPIPSFYPEGIYYIYSSVYSRANEYYGGFSYHSAHKSFRVGSVQTISFESNYSNTGTYYDQIIVQKGDFINITGISNVSTNLPLFMEIYKRGILYSVPMNVVDDKFSYILPVTADLAPDFTIIVYTISKVGKLYESVLAVHVDYSYSFDLSTDKETYEPGDTVTLTITPSENQTSMFAISFIDSAVLDVEPEDDSELAYFTMNKYYTYISSGSSWGSGFDYRSYWWYWCDTPSGGIYALYDPYIGYWREYDVYEYTPGAMEGSPPSFEDLLLEFDTDIRTNISESANWFPKLIISEPTELRFKLPDNIGEWTIRVVGNSLSESPNNIVIAGVVETIQIKTFLPFFIEFELPQPIAQDDILSVKGYVYNYIGTDVLAYVAIDAPNLIVLNKEVQLLTIPKGFVSEVEFSVYCKEPYLQNITLLAATNVFGTLYSDAKMLTTYIKPNGIEVINRTIGFLNVSDSPLLIDYSLDPLAIYHKETLSLYTDLMDISIDSWRSLIGYPYGCIEQTISRLLPSALIYDYLNKTGQLTASLEKEITLMVLEGLSRVYNFQHSDGGWGWWRNDGSKVIMTSIVVSALNQVEDSGFHINPSVLQKGIEYLIDHQHFNGQWDFQEYSSNALEATAYVLRAIINYQNITAEIEASINKAVDRFNTLWYSGGMKSSYAASLYFIATIGTTYQNVSFNNVLVQYIKDNKITEDNMIYWDSDQESPWYWRKLGNEVEITAYATLALAIDDYIDNYAVIQKAVRYLLHQKDRWGWRTTADTAAAITALTEIRQIATAKGFVNFNGTIFVSLNDAYPAQFFLNITKESNLPSEVMLSLSDFIVQGTNSINVSLTGAGQICYIFESFQILRSNPKVEIPALIEVSKGEQFNITVRFSEIDARMPILYATISLLDVPEDLQDPVENYYKFIPLITNGSEISFSLVAPTSDFLEYIIKGIKVTGFIRYTDSTDSSSYQLFHRTVGPILVKMESGPILSKRSNYYSLLTGLHSSDTNGSETLTLTKEVSKTSNLLPGDVITTTITISNEGDPRQFYVLEDAIPTGTTFLPDSVELSSVNNSDITHDLYSTGVHFFFPILPSGTTEITYQLQINAIKNSYSGQCKIWGMYDDICVAAQSITLENIPLKYYANHTIYRDVLAPTFSNVSVQQDELASEVEVKVQFRAFDNNPISKIRVIFTQGSGWRARTVYAAPNQELFTVTMAGFENVESEVIVFVEVYDIYGNIATSPLKRITIVEVIPYLIIGTIIGFAVGLASLFSFLSKRAKSKAELSQEEKLRKTQKKVSFLDSADLTEEELDQS
ncbi:MAG: MG2 domain-containing protein [Candidatus Hermodarchaeota archaeon]